MHHPDHLQTTPMFALQGVNFGVFGLGNKQYEHFCAVGKRIHKAMVSLGAIPVVERGDGDDDEDIEADFDKWREQLYAALDKSDVILKSGLTKVCFRLCHTLSALAHLECPSNLHIIVTADGMARSSQTSRLIWCIVR